MRAIPAFMPIYMRRVEGEKTVPYPDSRGRLTVGIGHTGIDVHANVAWTQPVIDAALIADMQTAAERLGVAIGDVACAKLLDCEYGALLSFVFNEGEVSNWQIWADIRAGNLADVPAQMRRFVYCNGIKIQGLVNRREADVALWLGLDPSLKQAA